MVTTRSVTIPATDLLARNRNFNLGNRALLKPDILEIAKITTASGHLPLQDFVTVDPQDLIG
jgi:hypothetical protein